MEIRDFNDKLLNAKKARFLAAVKVAAEHIGAYPPEVKFWDDTCPYDGGTEWAHIHLEYNIICVSKNRLQQMTYDKIDETATHEVTHLLEPDHSTGFHKEHENVKLASWRPPGGLVVIDEHSGNISKEKQKVKPAKIDKIRCNYHLCRKKEKLKRCPYCGRYLCTKHFNPIEPRIPSSYTTGRDDIVRDADLGHPCPDWVTFKEKEKKKQDEKYSETLKNLVKKSPEKERYATYEPTSSYYKRPFPYRDIVIAAILVLVGFGIWYFFFR